MVYSQTLLSGTQLSWTPCYLELKLISFELFFQSFAIIYLCSSFAFNQVFVVSKVIWLYSLTFTAPQKKS